MAKQIELPDGTIGEFPDDMPDEEITAVLQKQFSAPEAAPEAQPQAAEPKGDILGAFGLGTMRTLPFKAGEAGLSAALAADNDISFEEAQAAQDQRAAELRKTNPVSTTVGNITGLVLGGGALAKGLDKAGRAIGVATPTFEKGKRAVDTAKLMGGGLAVGAGEGAADAVVDGDLEALPGKVITGAGVGAVAAPLGAGATAVAVPVAKRVGSKVAEIAAPVVRKIGRRVAEPVERSFQVLSKRLGESADELQKRFDDFKADTGRVPTLRELIGTRSQGEIRSIGEAKGAAGEILQAASERDAKNLPKHLADQIPGRNRTTSVVRQKDIRKRMMDEAMGPIEKQPVAMTPDDLEFLASSDIREGLPRSLNKKIAQAFDDIIDDEGNPIPDAVSNRLTVRDMENMRLALRDRGGSGERFKFHELAKDVEGITAGEFPTYQSALKRYNRHSEFIDSIEEGKRVASPNTTKEFTETAELASPRKRAGQRVGAVTDLSDRAVESPRSAVSTARNLAEDSGVQERVASVAGPDEAGRLQRLGEAETQATRARLSTTPSTARTESSEASEGVQTLIETATAAGGNTFSAYRAGVAERLIDRLSISERTAVKIAEAITDPARTQEAIDTLRKARLNERDIMEIVKSAAAAAGVGGGSIGAELVE